MTAPPSPTATPQPSPTPEISRPADPLAYEIVRLVQAEDFATLDRYVLYKETPCTVTDDLVTARTCRAGEVAGTSLRLLATGSCKGGFFREDEPSPVTKAFLSSPSIGATFYAVFGGGNPLVESDADFSVAFDYGLPEGSRPGYWYEVSGGRITGIFGACGGSWENQWGATPEYLIPPNATLPSTPTPLPVEDQQFIERVVSLQRAGDWAGLEALVGFIQQPCVVDSPAGMFAPPACRPGEQGGTAVDVFFYAACGGAFWRSGDRDAFIDRPEGGVVTSDARFYGIFPVIGSLRREDYHIVFTYARSSRTPIETGFWFAVKNQRIVGQLHTCGGLPFAGPSIYHVPP